MDIFSECKNSFTSKKLKCLTTFKSIDSEELKPTRKRQVKSKKISDIKEEGLFPRINDIIQDLENMVVYRQGVPIPAPGINEEHDKILQRVNRVKEDLNRHLDELRNKLKIYEMTYVSIKCKFELEIPEKLVEGKKRPKEFYLTSKRKGYLRFQDTYIE